MRKNMRYKFDNLLIYSGRELTIAKYQPKFLNDWKIKMDKIDIPPTVFRAVNSIVVKRAYNHVRYNDENDEKKSGGSSLIEIQSVRYNALNKPEVKKFVISFSFIEDNAVNDNDEIIVSFDDMEV